MSVSSLTQRKLRDVGLLAAGSRAPTHEFTLVSAVRKSSSAAASIFASVPPQSWQASSAFGHDRAGVLTIEKQLRVPGSSVPPTASQADANDTPESGNPTP